MVDALGDLVNFVLLPGQRHDLIGAPPLLVGVEFEALIADKTYDSNELRAQLPACGATVVIPPRANRVEVIEYDSEMYKWRHTWWRISSVNSRTSAVLPCVSRRPMSATSR